MDCRSASHVARLLLFPCSCLLALGCTPQASEQLISPPPPAPGAEAKKHPDLPKQAPLPKTCVAYAEFAVHEACASNHTPREREDFWERARKEYQQALETDPTYLPALQGLARLYVEINDRERAVATYERAIAAHPRETSLPYELGMAYMRWKQWEPALVPLRTAFDLDPENRPTANALGICQACTGNYDECLAVFTKAFGNKAQAHYNLARTLHRLNRDDLCSQHLQMALNLNPDLQSARELLEKLAGKTEQAPPPREDKGQQASTPAAQTDLEQ
jgi:tetratricopeptide (TPR) repeat protein